jgi:hypothetical protein
MKTPAVVLGPCPCQACGRSLVWDGWFWLFAGTGIIHSRRTCPASFDYRVRPKGKKGRKGKGR